MAISEAVKICPQCKKEYKSKSDTQKFCSYECAHISYKGKFYGKRSPRKEIQCLNCHKIITVLESDKDRKYCSWKCFKEKEWGLESKTQIRYCEICGREFKFYPSFSAGRFCSQDCDKISRIGKTFVDLYGPKKAKEIGEKISNKNKKQGSMLHKLRINNQIISLTKSGFRCIRLDGRPIPDIIALHGDNIKAYAVEVEQHSGNPTKYVGINDYDDIYWFVYCNDKESKKTQREMIEK